MTYNFIIADITSGENNVFVYDERHQGKGGNALCSLRFRYHLTKWHCLPSKGQAPKVCLILLDNCVGQNKSQVVMKFMCLLSILFYETVALMFFLPGLTHMVADRVVANCKNSIKNLNLFSLGQITAEFNRVRGINAEWLRPDDHELPFRINWESALNKYFKHLPTGYTANFFYEFTKGYCTFRRLANTPNHEAVSIQLAKPIPELRKQILEDLFLQTDVMKVKMVNLSLPRHPGRPIAMKKLKSLGKKYFSTPEKYLKYYPSLPDSIKELIAKEESKTSQKRHLSGDLSSSGQKKRRVSRPKKQAGMIPGLQSVTKCFRPVKK